jgi:hypothetical protein
MQYKKKARDYESVYGMKQGRSDGGQTHAQSQIFPEQYNEDAFTKDGTPG